MRRSFYYNGGAVRKTAAANWDIAVGGYLYPEKRSLMSRCDHFNID
jgi:hypothetical protein